MHQGFVEPLSPDGARFVDRPSFIGDIHVADPTSWAALKRECVTAEIARVNRPIEEVARSAFDRTADHAVGLLVQSHDIARPVGAWRGAVLENGDQRAAGHGQGGGPAPVVEFMLARRGADGPHSVHRAHIYERQLWE